MFLSQSWYICVNPPYFLLGIQLKAGSMSIRTTFLLNCKQKPQCEMCPLPIQIEVFGFVYLCVYTYVWILAHVHAFGTQKTTTNVIAQLPIDI